jgi:tRNA1Val (adenine37-N6)-methyltransferase
MYTDFHFKQFSIKHAQSAHKVGTDGVLLGAWTDIGFKPNSILDIGSGTGLIALMMAQRSFAETIEGIEINDNAHEECVNNFENSIWNDRLFCYHGNVKDLAEEAELNYDLIVCNPPFFEDQKSKDFSKREQARKQVSLTYGQLLASVKQLLTKEGEFSTIIPFKDGDKFTKIAKDFLLYPSRITHVKGHAKSDFKRSLMQFSFFQKPSIIDELVLEISRHNYTEDYKKLVQDFYLKL